MENYIPKGDFIALYGYGSRVYGNAQPHSDHDFVGIQKGVDKGTIIQGKTNVKLMSPEHFQKLLDEHRMTALECYFLPDRHILKAPSRPWKFKLDKRKLYEAVTQRSDQDWTKARSRFNRSFDRYVEVERGRKSLFHSVRLLMFGNQIALNSAITDYGAANEIYEEIMTNPSEHWPDYATWWGGRRESLLKVFEHLTSRK